MEEVSLAYQKEGIEGNEEMLDMTGFYYIVGALT